MSEHDEDDDLPGVVVAGPPPSMVRIEQQYLDDLVAERAALEARLALVESERDEALARLATREDG